MLGDNIDTVNWPNCGEIDIMENIGREPSIVHGTFHGPGYSGAQVLPQPIPCPTARSSPTISHTLPLSGNRTSCGSMSMDSCTRREHQRTCLPARRGFSIIVLCYSECGGRWRLAWESRCTTVFPQQMLVDYVRVLSRATPSNVPVLFTDEGSNRALALDSVLFYRDPFTVNNHRTSRARAHG